MTDTSLRDAIGVELLVRAGIPRLRAEVEMATDPECQRIAAALVPVMERLATRIGPVLERLRPLLEAAVRDA